MDKDFWLSVAQLHWRKKTGDQYVWDALLTWAMENAE